MASKNRGIGPNTENEDVDLEPGETPGVTATALSPIPTVRVLAPFEAGTRVIVESPEEQKAVFLESSGGDETLRRMGELAPRFLEGAAKESFYKSARAVVLVTEEGLSVPVAIRSGDKAAVLAAEGATGVEGGGNAFIVSRSVKVGKDGIRYESMKVKAAATAAYFKENHTHKGYFAREQCISLRRRAGAAKDAARKDALLIEAAAHEAIAEQYGCPVGLLGLKK